MRYTSGSEEVTMRRLEPLSDEGLKARAMNISEPFSASIADQCTPKPNPEFQAPPDVIFEGGPFPTSEFRLIPILRKFVIPSPPDYPSDSTPFPDAATILTKAAEGLLDGGRGLGGPPEGFGSNAKIISTALADLAVSGRAALKSYLDAKPSENTLVQLIKQDASYSSFSEASIRDAVRQVLLRASLVLRALRGDTKYRTKMRGLNTILGSSGLGWVAVSGEDDPPHRPVNVPSAPFPQYSVKVRMLSNNQESEVDTRFMIASNAGPGEPFFDYNLGFPVDPAPSLPSSGPVFLYVHGHMSSLEESLDLTKALLALAPAPGFPKDSAITVIAMDLPGMGYSAILTPKKSRTIIDPTDPNGPIGALDKSQYPAGYPGLDFIETFIIEFVKMLDLLMVIPGTNPTNHLPAVTV